MSAYLVAIVDVTDPDQYSQYMAHTPRIIERFGGRFIARGAAPVTLEGEQETRRMVIVEFPTAEVAREMYESAEYTAARALRAGAADGTFIILDGFSDDEWTAALAASSELTLEH